MQVRLGALNVVVQVVTESLDHIDSLVLLGLGEVSIEQNYNNRLVLSQLTTKNRILHVVPTQFNFKWTSAGFNHKIAKDGLLGM